MGMSTSIVLLRSKDDTTYKKYLKILIACQEANIDIPTEVDEYFGGDGIDCNSEYPLEIGFKAREWNTDWASGYEIDLKDLPEGVETIRFYNSW